MEQVQYPGREASARSGSDRFSDSGVVMDFELLDFWKWMGSSLLNNAMRGVLAEFIVARALGIEGGVRVEWDACDLITMDGVRVEVKSAAYCQTWAQRRLSLIGFDIAPKWPDTIPTNERGDRARRAADVYVFCLLHHMEKESVEPMQLEQWTFYVLPARVLDERVPLQKRIALSSLLKLKPDETNYRGLSESLARASQKAVLQTDENGDD